MKKRYTEEKIVNQHETDIKVDAIAARVSSELRPKRADTGATGCGKTYLACAQGEKAYRQNKKVRNYRLVRRMEALKLGHADGSYLKQLSQLQKLDLLILDDWGFEGFKRNKSVICWM